MDKKLKNVAGNKVLFVGGPEAGNVRIVPESHGEHIKAEGDYIYRIWPMRIKGDPTTMYFAYAADQHPLQMYMDMWREYSPAAQIRRDTSDSITYQKALAK